MYAITNTSYRAIASADELLPGETASDVIPASLMISIDCMNCRLLRDAMLRSCDWTQVSDAPLDTLARSQWASYRQALRDVTTQSGFPDNVIWPTAPTLPAGAAAIKAIS